MEFGLNYNLIQSHIKLFLKHTLNYRQNYRQHVCTLCDLFMKYQNCYSNLLCLVAQSCLTLCDPMDCSPPGSSIHGDSPGKDTGVGCPALLQGIFPTQGSNPGLPHCRRILSLLSHQGSPTILGQNSNTYSSNTRSYYYSYFIDKETEAHRR